MNASKRIKWFLVMLLLATASIGNVWADHGHGHVRGHVGVYFGPMWGPWYYPEPYYYAPSPPVIIERAPPVYIEQADPQPAPAPINYWYYCNASKTYYPYVNECPGGWQRVAPQPPPPRNP